MLFLVSTPIGNLGDISERAKKTIESADLIACEDTRTSGQLFSLLGLKTNQLIPYHEHNADSMRPKLIEKLKKGCNIALVSDAGTPLISDPGYKLVRDCYQANISVTTIPGANAVLSALQLSGLPSDAFFFAGFLPPKTTARRNTLLTYKTIPGTLIIYETANRLLDVLQDIHEVLGNREMAVVREITKKFEEVKKGTPDHLIQHYQEELPKGELVLVIDRDRSVPLPESDIHILIEKTLQTYSVRDTAQLVAGITGLNKKEVYKIILDYQNDNKNKL